MTVLFDVRNLTKVYDLASGDKLYAVNDVSFVMNKGEMLGVVGESGSGKSTMGRCLVGLEEPTSGRIIYQGEELSSLERDAQRQVRRNMQIVFQNPSSSFNPRKTIGRALHEVAKFQGLDSAKADERIRTLLGFVHLDEEVLEARSYSLSGGQLQRLAIVRALIPDPDFILADEPVSALDVSVQAQILRLFDDLKTRLGVSVLFISHDLTVVEHLCDRVIVMYLGSLLEMAPTEELFKNPLHSYTKKLLASRPKEYPWQVVNRQELNSDTQVTTAGTYGGQPEKHSAVQLNGEHNQQHFPLVQTSPGHWVAEELEEDKNEKDQ